MSAIESSIIDTERVSSIVHDADTGDSIDRWLAVLVRLLHVSKGQREAIRDEVESHLRERVRDLMIAGCDENESMRTALGELGEVADLARRFGRAARSRTRRIIMNFGLIGIGALGIATAGFFVGGPGMSSTRVAVFEAPPSASADEPGVLSQRTVDIAFQDQPLETIFQYFAQSAGLDLVINRISFENHGIGLDEPVTLGPVHEQTIAQGLQMVSNQLDQPFTWRASRGVLEIATGDVFDRREIVLASFDISKVLDLVCDECGGDSDVARECLSQLIIDYVEPEAWDVNGGELGQLRIMGGKMFVRAPSRFHKPIEWILNQLEQGGGSARADDDLDAPVEAMGPRPGVKDSALREVELVTEPVRR